MGAVAQPVKLVSPFEFVSGAGTVYREVFAAPAAPDNISIHAAVTLPATGTTVVTTGITQPPIARVVRVKGNASGIAGNVVVIGKDRWGAVKTDTIALSGASAVDGVISFASITSITVPAKTNSSGDTVSVGVGAGIGLHRHLAEASILYTTVDGAPDSALPTVGLANNTVTFATAPNGTHNYVVCYVHVDLSNL
jgi:hypothetical protein